MAVLGAALALGLVASGAAGRPASDPPGVIVEAGGKRFVVRPGSACWTKDGCHALGAGVGPWIRAREGDRLRFVFTNRPAVVTVSDGTVFRRPRAVAWVVRSGGIVGLRVSGGGFYRAWHQFCLITPDMPIPEPPRDPCFPS